MKKIIPLSRLTGNKPIDSVREKKEQRHFTNRETDLLTRCNILYSNLAPFRQEAERCRRYVNGDQWGDMIKYKGKLVTERSYIIDQGNIPLVSNVLRRLLTSVTGIYVKSETEPVISARDREEQSIGEMLTITVQSNWQANQMTLLLLSILEEYLISGMGVERESYEYFNEKYDAFSEAPNVNKIFFDSAMNDPRTWDVSIIGQLHDIPFTKLASVFAKSREEYNELEDRYRNQKENPYGAQSMDIRKKNDPDRMNFYSPTDASLCRVIEVWTLENKERMRCHDPLDGTIYKIDMEDEWTIEQKNAERRNMALQNGIPENEIPYIVAEYFIDEYWYYRFLTPDGYVLMEGETPYAHKSHPYSIILYPFNNGDIHSFVSDFIDQQRYINRLLTIDDFVRRTGAKGVTMVPDALIPENMSPEEFAEQWSSVDGMIIYTPKPGVPEPKQFFSNAARLNTAELIQLQMNMLEDISSVHGALQGKQPYSGTSAALYAQQAQNSTAALAPLLLRFSKFVESIATKKVKLIQQYYTEPRVINIAGKAYSNVKTYDPIKARDVEVEVAVKESSATPVHRMVANDMLMEFWREKAITLEMLLENGDFPFADRLLQSIRSAKENMEKTGELPSLDLGQQQVPADMQQVQMAQNMLNKPIQQ